MEHRFSRTELLIGKEALARLKTARVAVFGVGGVGGYAVEALARSGVGSIDLIDHDKISISNLNRQIIATGDTIGRQKVEVMQERILSINPEIKVYTHPCFYLPETAGEFDFSQYTYVVDAVDTVTAKLDRHKMPACRSSAPWVPEISWIRRSLPSPIFIKPPCVRWPE